MTAFRYVLVFGAGAVVGALVTKKIIVDKYEETLTEEIDAMEEHYKKEQAEYVKQLDAEKQKNKIKEEPQKTEHKIPDDVGEVYTKYHAPVETEEMKRIHPGEGNHNGPYVITPEQYDDEMLMQDKVTLIYYNGDDVLADEADERVDISCIGEEALGHFGEYHDNTVYIRNERLGTDYEVVLDEAAYRDILGDPIDD